VSSSVDPELIPILWINLNSAHLRRARMEWALQTGGWHSHRFTAVDSSNHNQLFFPIPSFFRRGTKYPGIYRSDEKYPSRRTTRAELACLASWKRLLVLASRVHAPIGWYLLMEDDLGSCLSVPHAWSYSLVDLIDKSPSSTLAIQLAPVSASARKNLYQIWSLSDGHCLSVPKEGIRSHGNGAILLHHTAFKFLIDHFLILCSSVLPNFHPLFYPFRVRPVADKWIYAALPPGSCQVSTYPHFCLDAEDSSLHSDHVHLFHRPSRDLTLDLWRQDERYPLLHAQSLWEQIL